MKKLLCLALVLAMSVSVFAGCGKFDVSKEDLGSYVTVGDIDEISYDALVKFYDEYRAQKAAAEPTFYINAGYRIGFTVVSEVVNEDGTTNTIDAWTFNNDTDYVKDYDAFRYPANTVFDTALMLLVTDATVSVKTPRLIRVGEAFSFTMPIDAACETAEAAGKTVKFTITVKEYLPSLYSDSEISGKLSEFYDKYVVEKTVVENGDSIQIDFTGKIDGTEFVGGTAKDYVLTVGEGAMIPGFEEQIIGHKKGERFDITVTFPADYDEETLAGKEAVFTIKVDKIVNDNDLITENTPFETLWDLKEYYRLESYIEYAIADYVAAVSTPVAYPSKLVKTFEKIYEGYVAQYVAERMQNLADQGEEYTKAEVKEMIYPNGSDKIYIEENAKAAAYHYVLVHLLLKEFELEYTDKDYRKDLAQLASTLGTNYTAVSLEDSMGEEILRMSFIESYLSEYLMARVVGAPEFRAVETEE